MDLESLLDLYDHMAWADAEVWTAVLNGDQARQDAPYKTPAAVSSVSTSDLRTFGQVDTGDVIDRDFSTRPEIAAALDGVRTSGTRRSDTLDTDLLYVAVPVGGGYRGQIFGTCGTTPRWPSARREPARR